MFDGSAEMIKWFQNLDFSWMAWTPEVAIFFGCIAVALIILTALAIVKPETPRRGILGISTTRGDRFFISLLGSAFIFLASIALSTAFGLDDSNLWGVLAICLIFGIAVFRFV